MGSGLVSRGAEIALGLVTRLLRHGDAATRLGGHAMGAHYREDPVSGHLITFRYQIQVRTPSTRLLLGAYT